MRVVLAEDLYLLRDGLTRLLAAHGIDVTAAVGTGPELLGALLAGRPDLAIIDVRLPPTFTDEGLRAAAISVAQPSAPSPERPPTAGRGRAGRHWCGTAGSPG